MRHPSFFREPVRDYRTAKTSDRRSEKKIVTTERAIGITFVGPKKSAIRMKERLAAAIASGRHHALGTHQPATASAARKNRLAEVMASRMPVVGEAPSATIVPSG